MNLNITMHWSISNAVWTNLFNVLTVRIVMFSIMEVIDQKLRAKQIFPESV